MVKRYHNGRLVAARIGIHLIMAQKRHRVKLHPLPDVRDEAPSHLRHIGVIAFESFL
jgi:hypothetical protein